jgi:hypothetical protein
MTLPYRERRRVLSDTWIQFSCPGGAGGRHHNGVRMPAP